MKYSILIISLLSIVTTAFAQPNREELALRDEEQFDLSFMFQYENQEAFTITFSREDNLDNIKINSSECQVNGSNYEQPIADRYVYEQMLEYFQNINITSFQPTQNNQNIDSKLQVQGSISIPRTWTLNAFLFRHHPDNIGDETQILEYIVDILKDNSSDECSNTISEQLEKYVTGTE